jgi:hypothetical protein
MAPHTLARPRRTPWPSGPLGPRAGDCRPVGIVVAHYNTPQLIAQLVFSLYRLLGRTEFAELVVVDNASTDGSRELLGALHRAGLIHLLQNRTQRYHGPALTQGVSWLARHAADHIAYIWALDSDTIVLRQDTVCDALEVCERVGAALLGEGMGDPEYNRLLRHNRAMLHPFSLLLDPACVWRAPLPPFLEDGAPATALQVAADRCRLPLVAFPFVADGYLLHLGRGTLREIACTADTDNRYYRWALDHREYHFAGRPDGARVYRGFRQVFDAEVGELTPARLVAACHAGTIASLD